MAGLKYSSDGIKWTTLKNYTIKNVEVFQTTGENTDGVMSQKAVSDALAAKADTTALSEYVKEIEITEKVTEIVKESLTEGESQNDIKEAIDNTVADYIEENEDLQDAIEKSHEHTNKEELDKINEGDVDKWNAISDTDTTYTFAEGATNGAFTVTPKDGTPQTVNVHGLGSAAYAATGDFLAANGKAASATVADSANTVALSNVSGADDLKAIEGLTGTSGLLKKTAANTWALDTATYLQGSIKTVSANSNITNFSERTESGTQLHIIYTNTSSADTTVTIPTEGYKTPDGQQMNITVPKGGYAEVNLMNIDGTTYVRGL